MSLPGELPDAPPCPFCRGGDTELHSLFGSHASVTTFWCRNCRSPFEVMKWGRTHTPRKGGRRGDADSRSGGSGEPERETG